ncbi:hypothetical protein FACS1894191_4230 [Clostridia bacterium]|nr:hypothetical protein FACS1894191_4230 [Clostridia bacterium]
MITTKNGAGRKILALVLTAVMVFGLLPTIAPLTAYAADDFAQTYTWSDGNPPTLPGPANGGFGNGKFLVTLSGSPSGTLNARGNSVTIRGTEYSIKGVVQTLLYR